MIRFILTSLIICYAQFSLEAAETVTPAAEFADSVVPPTRIGLYGAGAFNFSNGEIKVWQTSATSSPFLSKYATDSLMYTDGSTTITFVGGGLVGIPLNRMIHFTGRLGVNWLTSSNEAQQRITSDSVLNHSLSSSAVYLDLSPGIEFHGLFGALPIYLLGGLEFGIPLSTSRKQTTDLLVNNVYQAQEVTTGPAKISDVDVRAAFIIGGGYSLRLTESVWLQPELTYRLPLTQVSSNAAYSPWMVGQLRLGVNLTFSISEAAPAPPPERMKPSARFNRLTTFDKDGREIEVSSLDIEDVAYTEMFPIVPYVFYPQGSGTTTADLQSVDVHPESGDFSPQTLPLDAVAVNRNTLNIIGTRMRATQHATLTITGTTDGKEESAIPDLPQKRAQWAKDYLVNNFTIEPQRISIRTTPTPDRPSAAGDTDGVAENRRVEFFSNVPDILQPLTITAENQRIATPNLVMFHPVVDNADTITEWTLTVMQAGKSLRDFHGKGRPSRITWSIKPNELSTAQVPVDYEFAAVAGIENADTVQASGSVPVDYFSSVRKRTENLPDRTIDKYSLILFDFDKATLNDDNSRVLEQMVLPSIKVNSKVTIVGYTDRIGTAEHNLRLSTDRANTVKEFLSSRARDAKYSASGVGETSEIFTNASPIGRQLSRTVQIVVETERR
ncbi:MAG: OmpA family protein [Ignavibacteria bacterium]|nr:OmpA family protein [Ignavibacteria bacterium]